MSCRPDANFGLLSKKTFQYLVAPDDLDSE